MPRVIIGANAPPPPTEILTDQLAAELTSPGELPQPLIVERHIRGTKSRHVWVVWDRWSDFDEEERTAVIVEAYAKAEGYPAADNISIALGIVAEDAAVLGLLPWAVEPANPRLLKQADYRAALAAEARNTVRGETAKELRYPTGDEANRAVERLKQASPQTLWVVRQDLDEED